MIRKTARAQKIIVLLAVCFAGCGRLAFGQSDWVVRDSYEPTAPRLVYTAARAMGMLRGVQEFDIWKTLRYEGSGVYYDVTGADPAAWRRIELDRYYVEIAYPDAGLRQDVTTSAGERSVWATAFDHAWNEQNVAPEGPPVGDAQVAVPAQRAWRQALAG